MKNRRPKVKENVEDVHTVINSLSKQVLYLELVDKKNYLEKRLKRKERVFGDVAIKAVERTFRSIEESKLKRSDGSKDYEAIKREIIKNYQEVGTRRRVFNLRALFGIW